MRALVAFDDGEWLRIVDGDVVSRGNDTVEALPLHEGEIVVGVVPARDTVVRMLDLPNLSDAQANAAARLTMVEQSLSGERLHVAAGPADSGGQRVVVAVEAEKIAARLRSLATLGLDPERLWAAPLLLPRPEIGFVRASVGAETLLRGQTTGFLDDPGLTEAIVGDARIIELDQHELEAAIADAVHGPGTNLRHGIFAKRTAWSIDVVRLKRFSVMTLVLGLLILGSALVVITRLNVTAARVERQNITDAAALLPLGTIVTNPTLQTEARLAAMRGAGGGFGLLASAFATAVNATPDAEVGAMVFDGEGGLRATIRAGSAAELSDVVTRLSVSGLRAEPGPIFTNQGRPYRDVTVRLP